MLPGTFESCGCHGRTTQRFRAERDGLEKLRACLETEAGSIARLLMIGHCVRGPRDTADTVFLMGYGEEQHEHRQPGPRQNLPGAGLRAFRRAIAFLLRLGHRLLILLFHKPQIMR